MTVLLNPPTTLQIHTYLAYRRAKCSFTCTEATPEEHLIESISQICKKYSMDADQSSRELLSTSFREIRAAGVCFLERCREFESTTGISLRTKSNYPLYHHLRISALDKSSLTDDHLVHFKKLKVAEIDKCEKVLACYQWSEAIFKKKLSDNQAKVQCQNLVGSIIHRVVLHIQQFHHAEITFPQNIQFYLQQLTMPICVVRTKPLAQHCV